jgi:hypothetical protein
VDDAEDHSLRNASVLPLQAQILPRFRDAPRDGRGAEGGRTLMPCNEKLRLQIPVQAEGIIWLTVLGCVHLALRHPEYKGPSRHIAVEFAGQLRDKLHREGLLSDEEIATIFRDEMMHQNTRRK